MLRALISISQNTVLRWAAVGAIGVVAIGGIGSIFNQAVAQQFEEGTHYTKFDLPKTEKPTVTEIYSVFCPGCFAFEANYRMIKSQVPASVVFERHHSGGMVGTNAKAMEGIAKLNSISEMYPDELSNRLMWDVFIMIHEQKKKPDVPDLHRILGKHNSLVKQDLHKLYDSFQVRSVTAKSEKLMREWRSEGVTKGTPTWVVNGQYRINISELNRDQFFQEFYALLNYLLEK